MKAIGIDYQQTLSVICLREGRGVTAKLRSVGDGLRHLVPNAVLGDELWGSRALRSTSPDRYQGDPQRDGPWLDEPGPSIFWREVYQRLYSYLGRVKPTIQNDYQVAVGLHAANYLTAVKGVARLCHAAGLSDATCIPATDGLLCRWLAEQGADEAEYVEPWPTLSRPPSVSPEQDVVVAVVAVGDTATLVSAYRIRWERGCYPRVMAKGQLTRHIPTGHATWMAKVLERVHAQFSEPIAPGYELTLRDAVIGFVARLRRASVGQPVEWTGVLRERMFAPLQLTRRDCASWPGVTSLTMALPTAIRDVVTSVSNGTSLDQILVGGVGALWPFATDAANTVGPVWQSDTPEEDIARGAAWWSEIQTCFNDTSRSWETVHSWDEDQPVSDTLEVPRDIWGFPGWHEDQLVLDNRRGELATGATTSGLSAVPSTEPPWPGDQLAPDNWTSDQSFFGPRFGGRPGTESTADHRVDEEKLDDTDPREAGVYRWPEAEPALSKWPGEVSTEDVGLEAEALPPWQPRNSLDS